MLRRVSPVLLSLALGAGFYLFLLPPLLNNGFAAYLKLSGSAEQCSWSRTLGYHGAMGDFDRRYQKLHGELRVVAYDAARNLERVATHSTRSYWLQRVADKDRIRGFGWLLAEHEWMEQANPGEHVQKGDTVIDCGAHVGVFTAKALARGAARVVAVEPDPANLECLRRNFSSEIAAGRVVLAGVGVWSSPGSMKLSLGEGGNTGVNSMVHQESEKTIEVPVTTLDRLVEELRLEKVHFIKMDIEGAEREALKGAAATLAKHHPRLMLDLNHRPDDSTVLPAVIRAAWSGYQPVCGPCQMNEHGVRELLPHVIYFH